VDRDRGALAQEELRDVLERATAAFGAGTEAALEAEIARHNRRAIAFLGLDPHEAQAQGLLIDAAAAARAIAALRRGEVPPPAALDALELCIRFMRPAWLFRKGSIEFGASAPCPADERAHIEAAGRFTLGVTLDTEQRDAPIGTGFLVAVDRLITNDHVRKDILARWGRPDDRALADRLALARFGLEDGATDRWSVAILGVVARHPSEDVVVLRLAPDPRLAALPLPTLAEAPPALGAEIAVIGHPLPDARNPIFGSAVFGIGGAPGVRRASPGRVIRGGARFSHDCSTLGGSSGSPVIDRRTGVVVGVHAGGAFAVRNTGVATAALFAEPALRDCIGRQRFV
jgi:V8-like Glu-specific endopeptidase